MNHLINDKRFKKIYSTKEIKNSLLFRLQKQIIKFPEIKKDYFNFFNSFAKKNYKLIETKCLCRLNNDIKLSNTDRHFVKFITVVCKNCGLIRAKNYFTKKNVKNFYIRHYRKIKSNEFFLKNPSLFYYQQVKDFRPAYKILKQHAIKRKKLKIVDVGGGIGGFLDYFKNNHKVYLADYVDVFLNFAKKKGISIIKGGLNNIKFKPDIIILSHVIEHWNDFHKEIMKLIKLQKKNLTVNYIEFPGIDSLKLGRRDGDILGDIHVPHFYYFSTYVFENIMNRYGFAKIYMDNEIRSIFIFTGKKLKLINNYNKIKNDLLIAERTRKIFIIKNILKFFIHYRIIFILKKIYNLINIKKIKQNS
jgi:hypothetical protein